MSSRAEKRAAARMAKKQEARAEREAQGIYTPSSSIPPSPATRAPATEKKKQAASAKAAAATTAAVQVPASQTSKTTEEQATLTMERVLREVSLIRDNNNTLCDDISLMEQSVNQLIQNGDLISTSSSINDSSTSTPLVDGDEGRKSMREVKLALRKRAERLHYNCMGVNEHCMRLFFSLDRVTGDSAIKVARKDAVQQVQQLSDWIDAQRLRLEALLRDLPSLEVLSPSPPPPSSSPSHDDLAALADDLMRDLTSPTSTSLSSAIATATSTTTSDKPPSLLSESSPRVESKPTDVDTSVGLISSIQSNEPTNTSGGTQRRTMTIIGIVLLAILVAYILSTH